MATITTKTTVAMETQTDYIVTTMYIVHCVET